jgi:hypothetical protein
MCYTQVSELGLETNGYVPRGLGIGGGDYVSLMIDTETGRILDWKPLEDEDLRAAFPKSKNKD